MAWNPSPEVQVARDAATAIGKVRPFFVMALSAKSQRTVSGLSADCQRTVSEDSADGRVANLTPAGEQREKVDSNG